MYPAKVNVKPVEVASPGELPFGLTSHILQVKLFNELGYMGKLSFDVHWKSVKLSFGSFV